MLSWAVSKMCMTDVGRTQDNFILPALPVGGLPISQNRLDRMELVHDRTIPIIYLLIWCLKSVLAESAFSLPLMPIWLGT